MDQYKILKFNAFLVVTALAAAVLVPMASVFSSWGVEKGDIWSHLISTSLIQYSLNTVSLAVGVALLSGLLGVALAILTVFYEFPGRKFFGLLAFGPLVFPPYVMGFVLLGMFEQSSPLAMFISSRFEVPLTELPQFGGLFGATLSLSVSLFPYIYMMTRIAFEQQSQKVLEAGRSLGLNGYQAIMKLALPLARPWIISGLLIVCMEVMADFGTVSVFSFDTYTTGIFKAWFGFFDFTAACQLASVLLVGVNLLYLLKLKTDKSEEKYQSSNAALTKRIQLTASQYSIPVVLFACFFLIFLVLPVFQLSSWSIELGLSGAMALIEENLYNTLMIAILSGAAIIICSVFVFTLKRLYFRNSVLFASLASIPNIGYAFPGAVLAVGLVVPFNLVDRYLNFIDWIEGGFFAGSLGVLILGLTVRFYAVGSAAIVGGLNKIPKNTDEAAMGMGVSGFALFKRTLLPLLKSPILYGFIFCLIDVAKELPLTLMARPMGWDTLSVKIYEWTSEGEWEKAALPSLMLVYLGFVSLWLMIKAEKKQ
jgi:iron(III) transport system permease protein